MGKILTAKEFMRLGKNGLYRPIIYCCKYPGVEEVAISINKEVAERLKDLPQGLRSIHFEKELLKVIEELPPDPVIKNFDVVFSKQLTVDPIRIFVYVARTKEYSLIWPGRVLGNKLVYGEPEYKDDYKEYNIDDYDITCII